MFNRPKSSIHITFVFEHGEEDTTYTRQRRSARVISYSTIWFMNVWTLIKAIVAYKLRPWFWSGLYTSNVPQRAPVSPSCPNLNCGICDDGLVPLLYGDVKFPTRKPLPSENMEDYFPPLHQMVTRRYGYFSSRMLIIRRQHCSNIFLPWSIWHCITFLSLLQMDASGGMHPRSKHLA